MTLRLGADTARAVTAAHGQAADAARSVGSPPGADAGEADEAVHQLLDAFREVRDDLASVNEIVGAHVQRCTDLVESADLQVAQSFTTAGRDLP